MHIDDWHEDFLSKLDPAGLLASLRNCGAQQVVVKCRSHTGLAYYPTRIGRMHRGLRGRDYVKEMIDLCHQNNIAVMAYFSQIFDNWAYENHPSWRVINGEGLASMEYENATEPGMFRKGRYGIVCPNNHAYRYYVKACLTEITTLYDFESIFLDMPFWPEICYCSSCKEKYYQHSGEDIPRTINWSDNTFRRWQAVREEWMGEFAAFSAACVKTIRPSVTIEHNLAVATAPWQFGSTDLIAESCDYVGGDLYGGYLEQTFICKYYKNLSRTLPFAYITSRCEPSLSYHTTTKTEEQLLIHAITALVHNGALSICDGANPDGTLCEAVYNGVIKRVFERSRIYETYISGQLLVNAAIWFSSRSKYDASSNGKSVTLPTSHNSFSHDFISNPLKMAQIMREENIAFDVLPACKLSDFSGKLLVISNVMHIRDDEMAAIDSFIRRGGNVYVSGNIGHPKLLDILEAEMIGETEDQLTYMSPTADGRLFFSDFDHAYPMAVVGTQLRVRFSGEFDLLATTSLPYTLSGKRQFSSIHANPPGIKTSDPAAVLKTVGAGKILWLASPIENSEPYMSRQVVGRMVRELSGDQPFTSNAPAHVEIVNWVKEERMYFALINQQETAPHTATHDLVIRLPYRISAAAMVESSASLSFINGEETSVIYLPKLELFYLLNVEPDPLNSLKVSPACIASMQPANIIKT